LDYDLICILQPLACVLPPPAPASIPTKTLCDLISLCFVTPPVQTAKVFGFAEFVQAFALLVVIYTVSDVRYHFRISVAPFDIWKWTFVITALIGFGTLIADFWYGNQFPVPTFLESQTYPQAFFGALFISTVMTWLWFGFMRPPIFGRKNAHRYAHALYSHIVRGSDDELPQIAAELGRSAHALVSIARSGFENMVQRQQDPVELSKPTPENYARDIMSLIANRKFCRTIVASAPGTAIRLFDSVTKLEKHGVPLNQFASNIFTEALLNKDSIFYHEGLEFRSGLIAHTKPFSTALFGDFQIIDNRYRSYPSPLDVDYQAVYKWDADQVEAYGRAVLLSIDAYLRGHNWWEHSSALSRAFENLKSCTRGLNELDALTTARYETDAYRRLREACQFAGEAIDVLQKHENLIETSLRRREGVSRLPPNYDLTDMLVDLIVELILDSTAVRSADFFTWEVQHNTVWRIFDRIRAPNRATKIIQFKLRRALYDEITRDTGELNFKSARLLGFCLYVLGLTVGSRTAYGKESYALRKVLLKWTAKNYLKVRADTPAVADTVLMGRISYDKAKRRLVKTYEGMLGKKGNEEYLPLEAPKRPKRPRKKKQPDATSDRQS
jgi:hypothetical protein